MAKSPKVLPSPVEICRRRRINVLTMQGYVNLAVKALAMIIAVLVVFTQVFMVTQQTGMGMFPAIEDGDLVLAYRLHRDYQKGDVVVYTVAGTRYLGRILARETDVVYMDDGGTLQINGTNQGGEIMYPTYAKPGTEYPYRVQEGSFYILGDYRTQTTDSRDFGSISLDDIQGKVITIVRRRGV